VSLKLTSSQKERPTTRPLTGSRSVTTFLQIPTIFLEAFFHGFPDGDLA